MRDAKRTSETQGHAGSRKDGNRREHEKGDLIVKEMLEADAFSRWLGIQVKEIGKGTAKLSCVIREEMTNGFDVVHGGVLFSLADSALAFAAASTGRKALTLESSISFLKPVYAGAKLTIVTESVREGKRVGHYQVRIFLQNGDLAALFKGSVLFASEPVLPPS